MIIVESTFSLANLLTNEALTILDLKPYLSPDFVKVFTAKPDTKHLGKVFHEKCKLGYDMLLANRADIRIRFALLLDANIPELRHKDIVYLGSCLTVLNHSRCI